MTKKRAASLTSNIPESSQNISSRPSGSHTFLSMSDLIRCEERAAGAPDMGENGGDGYYQSVGNGKHHRRRSTGRSSVFSKENVIDQKRTLTFWPLLALIFFTASGGPFGIEGLVAEVGPLLAVIGYIGFPIIWSIPEGLMTAELASTFPENAGSVAWVSAAFGDTFGYMRGCFSWLAGVIDNSIYPVLFVDYLASADSRLNEPTPRIILTVIFTVLLTYLNYRGLDLAGKVAIGVCVSSLLPFAILCLLGLGQIDLTKTSSWSDDTTQLTQAQWLGYVNVLFWNLNSFDSAASFAGEVPNPGKVYPKAMISAIVIIVVSYALTILVAATTTDIPYSTYTDGTFTKVAMQLGGDWLAGWIVLAAAISNVGLFLAEMSSDAYQMMGMAEVGLLPSFLGHKSPYGTPTYAIFLSAAGIIFLSITSSFNQIIIMVNFLYALAEIFEIAAFLVLRFERPDLPRPYRMPVSNLGAVAVMFLPLVFICIVLLTATARTWLISGGLACLGVASFYVMDFLKSREICSFYVTPPTPSFLLSDDDDDDEEEEGGELFSDPEGWQEEEENGFEDAWNR